MDFEKARFNMIEQQVRPWDVLDPDVLNLLATVHREDFVPAGRRGLAYADCEIPLGPQAVMLAPRVEARALQALQLKRHEKVLEVGTGSGYMAALLAHRAQQVISLEIEPSLAASARDHLRQAGIYNAQVLEQDGSNPLNPPELAGSFDVILLSGSVAAVPEALKSKLKVGGRLMAIVGKEPVMSATLLTRLGDDQFRTEQNWETMAPRLQHFPEPSAFRF